MGGFLFGGGTRLTVADVDVLVVGTGGRLVAAAADDPF